MSGIQRVKRESVQKNQTIKVYSSVQASKVFQVFQVFLVFLLFLVFNNFFKSPLRSVLLEVHVYNVVREIHGIVLLTVHFILRGVQVALCVVV